MLNNTNTTNLPELDNYDLWQLETYGNVIPHANVMPDGSCEAKENEIERSAAWVSLQHEMQLSAHY